MAEAYKCDKCGELFEKKRQEISVPFRRTKLGMAIWVGVGVFDLCPECVEAALEVALERVKEDNLDN